MKKRSLQLIAIALFAIAPKVANGQANTSLSNLTATAVNQHLVPNTDNTKNLGSSGKGWKNIYTAGSIYLGGNRFINNNGTNNTFIGASAGISNTVGYGNSAVGYQALYSNTYGVYNTAIGYHSLFANTTGDENSAIGTFALYSNTTGSYNTAIGRSTLFTNSNGSWNVAIGEIALASNYTGNKNVAIGYSTLYNNASGFSNTVVGQNALHNSQKNSYNVAIGDSALYKYDDGTFQDYMVAVGSKALSANISGYNNTAVGGRSLLNNTYGVYNTALGTFALNTVTTGSGNTALGKSADVNDPNRYNATAVGYSAIATADNQVMLGNTSVTAVWAAGPHVIYSDGRVKKNIKDNVPGLAFINLLKPVTYSYDIHGLNKMIGVKEDLLRDNSQVEKAMIRKEKVLYTGFVAQEVEQAADKLGYDFSGVYKPQNDKDAYGLSYADFVVPLVKAVQELSKMNNAKNEAIDSLRLANNVLNDKIDVQQKEIEVLKTMMLHLQTSISNCSPCAQSSLNNQLATITIKQQHVDISVASLEQNIPNPFNPTTTISYTLPPTYSSAKIIVMDKTGKKLKEANVSGTGKGSLQFDAATLAAGAYNYSLYVNGKLIATKQMMHIE